jgi:ATP-binding cassette subfamily C protein CydC
MADLWRFLALMRPRIGWVMTGILTSLLTTAAGIVLLGLVGGLVVGGTLVGGAAVAGLVLRGLAILRGGGRYAEKLSTHQATFRVIADLRVWFFDRAIPLAPAKLGGVRAGDLLSRMVSDIDALDGLYQQILVPTTVALVLAIPVGLILADVAPYVAWLALGALLIAAVAIPAIAEACGRSAGREQLKRTAELRTLTVDQIQGLPDLLANEAEGRHRAAIQKIERARDRAGLRASIVSAVSAAGSQALGQGTVVLVVVLGALAIQAGRTDLQSVGIAAFVVLAAFEAVAPLPFAYQMLGRTRAAARRILQIADAEPAVTDPVSAGEMPRENALELSGVGFRYPGADTAALEQINLSIGSGERVALVGPSGSGKSTLVSLILRFHDPDRGTVKLGGVDVRTLSIAALHGRIGMLSQSSPILAGTLRANLAVADPEASDARMREVLEACGLKRFLEGLPLGLEAWLGETGARVSGGQARRIALARVMLKDAPILLLDEPTEGLDADTERALIETLRPLVDGRTVLIISHRPAAASLAHRVVRMEAGRFPASNVPDSRPVETP